MCAITGLEGDGDGIYKGRFSRSEKANRLDLAQIKGNNKNFGGKGKSREI